MTKEYKECLSKSLEYNRDRINNWDQKSFNDLCSSLPVENNVVDLILYLGVVFKVPTKLKFTREARVVILSLDGYDCFGDILPDNSVFAPSIKTYLLDYLPASVKSEGRLELLRKLISSADVEIIV